MVMKLYENLKPNKIRIIYDNKHYYNKWLFRKGTKITFFFSPLRKKSIFTEDLSAEDHVTEKT